MLNTCRFQPYAHTMKATEHNPTYPLVSIHLLGSADADSQCPRVSLSVICIVVPFLYHMSKVWLVSDAWKVSPHCTEACFFSFSSPKRFWIQFKFGDSILISLMCFMFDFLTQTCSILLHSGLNHVDVCLYTCYGVLTHQNKTVEDIRPQ